MKNLKKEFCQINDQFIVNYYTITPKNNQTTILPPKQKNKVFYSYINGDFTIIGITNISLNTNNLKSTLNQPFNIKFNSLISKNSINEALLFINKSENYSYFVGDHLRILQNLKITFNKKEL